MESIYFLVPRADFSKQDVNATVHNANLGVHANQQTYDSNTKQAKDQ
jgi:hypothetical protein